jgi:tRNA-Thr(GGU) m(6)t(6)A37 methyltransferase TsaA
MPQVSYEVRPIAWVESALTDLDTAPNQGDEDAPDAVLVFDATVTEATKDITVGDELLLLSWLDRARRDVLSVHPRGDERRPLTGVFSTRSPHRPNPIGLHRVRVISVDGVRVGVRPLEAVDGTPVIDVKPVLEPIGER